MKKFLGIFVPVFLIVSSASWGETEDRYEIEGMSVEDNLLDYFSLETIEKGRPSQKYYPFQVVDQRFGPLTAR